MDKLCLLACLIPCFTGCQTDPGDASHEHEEPEATQITTWNPEIELFIEHPPFVAGEPTRFVTHVTHLDGWRPRTEGEILVVLSKPGESPIEIRDPTPARDGIYIPTLTFPRAGTWEIEVRVPMEDRISVQKIPGVRVYESTHDAAHAPAEESAEEISFLKEQQWRMPFASHAVEEQIFRESLSANGAIAPRAGGEAFIHAPLKGRLHASGSAMPHIGVRVQKGQLLGSLIPLPVQANDQATLALASQRAELAHDYAKRELERIEGLFRREAIPESRFRLAELEVNTTAADLKAARERLQQVSAAQKETADGSGERVDLYAPFSGTMIEANAASGALVEEGEPIFHIIDLDRLWLTIQIPEVDIGRVMEAQGAWFRVEGLERVFEVSPETGGRLVAMGGKIDPNRRTLPLIFELINPDAVLKVGMFARVSVLTGNHATGPSVSASALVEEGGQTIAYVQSGGESFERRVLQLGIRDGDRVQVRSGLVPGERVVTMGAYQIRLATTSTTAPAHGHGH